MPAAELLRKYETMRALREDTSGKDPKDALRALAGEFPGALREIDDLPLEEIVRRIAHLRAVTAGAAPEPWVMPLDRYHAILRDELARRREGPITRGAGVVDTALVALCAELGTDLRSLRTLLFPPRPRRGA